jgi:hypothetical protein
MDAPLNVPPDELNERAPDLSGFFATYNATVVAQALMSLFHLMLFLSIKDDAFSQPMLDTIFFTLSWLAIAINFWGSYACLAALRFTSDYWRVSMPDDIRRRDMNSYGYKPNSTCRECSIGKLLPSTGLVAGGFQIAMAAAHGCGHWTCSAPVFTSTIACGILAETAVMAADRVRPTPAKEIQLVGSTAR